MTNAPNEYRNNGTNITVVKPTHLNTPAGYLNAVRTGNHRQNRGLKGHSMNTTKYLRSTLVLLALALPASLWAHTFVTLHSFTGKQDGSTPYAGLTLAGNTLYGTTAQGGRDGIVFAINTNGTGFTTLYVPPFSGFGGDWLGTELTAVGNTLYGTESGCQSDTSNLVCRGSVFALNTDGTGFTRLYSLTNEDSLGSVIVAGNTLYGTAGPGTIFAANTDGSGYTILHTNAASNSGLVLAGNTLYGTSYSTVIAIHTNGTDFTVLHTFTESNGGGSQLANGGLILAGDTLYGTTSSGGNVDKSNALGGNGTVFAIHTNGTGFTVLYAFSGGVYSEKSQDIINSDGAWPRGGLIVAGNTLYGTASTGGSFGNGTVFAIQTNGTGFATLHTFSALHDIATDSTTISINSDGASPDARLTLAGDTLYGTADSGGSAGNGTVFAVSTNLPVRVTGKATTVLTMTETWADKLACTSDGPGGTSCDPYSVGKFTVTAVVTTNNFKTAIDPSQFDTNTIFNITVGNYKYRGSLGDDPKYTPGKSSAKFQLIGDLCSAGQLLNGNGCPQKAYEAVTLSITKKSVTVSITATTGTDANKNQFENDIDASFFDGNPTGKYTDAIEFQMTLGNLSVSSSGLAVKATVATHTDADGNTLSNVSIKGTLSSAGLGQ